MPIFLKPPAVVVSDIGFHWWGFMYGVQKMIMWKGKPIASLKGNDIEQFRQAMAEMGQRRAFAPAMPQHEINPNRPAVTNLRGE